jgi:hypothetical protein
MATAPAAAPRRVVVTARAAADLKHAGWTGANTPYLELRLGGTTVETRVESNGENPVWDEAFALELPPPSPEELDRPPVLHVAAKNASRLLPDRVIGSGSLPLDRLLVGGEEEARVPLRDAANHPAGVAYVGVRLAAGEGEGEVPSAAGGVLGELHRGPAGAAAEGKAGPDAVPTVGAGPATPLVGAAAPGALEDPSQPAYGILQE